MYLLAREFLKNLLEILNDDVFQFITLSKPSWCLYEYAVDMYGSELGLLIMEEINTGDGYENSI